MNEADARARLVRMVAADTEPVLAPDDLDALITLAKRTDASGMLPSDPAWVPTWDLNSAASTGWEWKAGKATAGYDFGSDGQNFRRSQLYDHCVAMSQRYGGSASPQVGSMITRGSE